MDNVSVQWSSSSSRRHAKLIYLRVNFQLVKTNLKDSHPPSCLTLGPIPISLEFHSSAHSSCASVQSSTLRDPAFGSGDLNESPQRKGPPLHRKLRLNEMRPVFCGNFEYDARQSEIERLFGRYGKVDRVDMKSGFAFIYMEDERDAEDAIRALDRTEFGRHGRRLRVEWTKQERGGRRSGSDRRSSGNSKPTKTLFVINFDPINTRMRDLERHFEPYGKVLNVRIRRNFAFIQFDSQDDATKALEATNMSKLMDRVISVEYAVRDDDERRNGYSPDRRGRDRSPERRSRDRERSASPHGRGLERASPDYGRGPSSYSKPEERGSPNYGRPESPAYERHHSRSHSSSPARRERDHKMKSQFPST